MGIKSFYKINIGDHDYIDYRFKYDLNVSYESKSHAAWQYIFALSVLIIFCGLILPLFIIFWIIKLLKSKKLYESNN